MSEEIVSSEDMQFYEYLGLLEQAYYDTHVGSKAGTIITETIKSYVNILKYKNNKLQQKVEQLEKDKSYANWYAVKKEKEVEQLENIRKEAIEYINKNWGHWCSNHCEYATETINILNKGSDKE